MNKRSIKRGMKKSQEPQATPKQKQKANAYMSILSKMMHSEETKASVYEMLQAGDPMQTIPATALQINSQAEEVLKKKGGKPDLDTLVMGAQFLVGDLMAIGNAGGFFEINPEDPNVVGPLLTNTIQPYIEKGLEDGSIDPIELQAKIEPLMSKEAKAEGLKIAGKNGMPEKPGVTHAMDTAVRQDQMQKGVLNA